MVKTRKNAVSSCNTVSCAMQHTELKYIVENDTIPLNHFFESAPVSRSQAKQLLSRLEQFREVELDFERLIVAV